MNPIHVTVIVCAAIAAATLVLLFVVIPRTWGHFWAAIDNRVDQLTIAALARPNHARDWDAEMMALVAAEQHRDDA